MIAGGFMQPFDLENPVEAIRKFSQDPTLQAEVRRKKGGMISAVDIQKVYLDQARKSLVNVDDETTWIMQEWERVLHDLECDRMNLVGKIDWVTKWWLLETFVQQENVKWDDPWLASLDLEYHNLDPERGLFRGLEAEGRITRMCQEEDIDQAIIHGPLDTRGGLRGLCMQRFGRQVTAVQWERMVFQEAEGQFVLDLADHVDPESVVQCKKRIEQAQSPREFLGLAWPENISCGG